VPVPSEMASSVDEPVDGRLKAGTRGVRLIRVDSPRTRDVRALLLTHERLMRSTSPPDACHVLDLDGLGDPSITLFSARSGGRLLAIGAIKDLGAGHGEVKSMHTLAEERGAGHGSALLRHLVSVAREREWSRLSLETGSQDAFEPARSLYRRHGFVTCAPFGDYQPNPCSTFMTREL
jgi:putative acetyltransferase